LAFAVGYLSPPVQAQDFEVTTLSDDGPGSLRAAIVRADSYDDIIRFNVTGTIKLNSQLEISGDKGMKIQGPGADLLSVSGNDTCRVFYIGDTVESVDISGISIVSGDAGSDGGENYGGGIYNESDKLSVDNCRFSGNQAGLGGGMYNSFSNPKVNNCTFSTNSAGSGGGMCNMNFSPEVTNCTFFSNSATYGGGGISNYVTINPKFTNCTFTGNSAGSGGGMSNFQSGSTVTNCTFYLNSAPYGGGIEITSPCELTITNCIFWGDTGGEIPEIYSGVSYCVISDDNPGDTNINIDPRLQPLADKGGLTMTCALSAGSSAIDAGNTIAEVSTDQRGAPRPYNGNFDIGAYESGLEVYEITATCSDGGTISPTEAHTLAGIEDEVFYLMPAEGYEIEAVYVDKGVVSYDEASNTYTFKNVSKDCDISADFALKHFTITALSCDYGAITPASVDVVYSDDVTFTISPEEYYYLDHLYVDGNLVSPDEGETVTYTFENVSDNHEISADFRLSATDDDDDDIVNRDSDGCNISALPGIGLLLVLPIMFLFGKMK
jgi:hypothetical protein